MTVTSTITMVQYGGKNAVFEYMHRISKGYMYWAPSKPWALC